MSTAPPAWPCRPRPYLCWDHREPNHGPVFSVESVALCCLMPVSLPPFVLFISTNRFLLSRAQCWYFLRDVKIPAMAICCLLWGVIREHCSTTTVVYLFSKSNHLFSFLKKKKICLFAFQWPYCERKVYLCVQLWIVVQDVNGVTEPRLNVSVATTASSFDSIKWSLS